MPKLAEQVARRIEQDIADQGWPVGQVLGSEAELQERYDVSRAVLREAIRLLEHNLVASMRRGPGGGLVVREPAASVAAEAIAASFLFSGVTLDEIFGARVAVEGATVALAADRVTEDGIDRLRTLVEAESDEDHHLHIALAREAGNTALLVFVAALTRATGRLVGPAGDTVGTGKAARAMHEAHRAIVESVVRGDGASAQRRMSRHLDASLAWIRTLDPPPQRETVTRLEPVPGRKLGTTLAEVLTEDIVRRKLTKGELIASEAELVERYEVSRAVVREAIRLLEHYGVAVMRRGPGGGLVVGPGRSSRVLDVVCNYLQYAGLHRDVIHDARLAVELSTVAGAAARIDADGRARLEQALEREAELPDDVVPEVGGIHVVIADLAGNRALASFVRVLTRLTALVVPEPSAYPPDTRETVMRAHRAIVDAVIAGDGGLAAHRMRRHLDALALWMATPEGRRRAA